MESDNPNTLFAAINNAVEKCSVLTEELDEMKKHTDFLIEQYNTNKRYFCDDPCNITIEDVIRGVFNYAWAMRNVYEYKKILRNKNNKQ